MIKTNQISGMDTYTAWMLISIAGAILAMGGEIIGSWTLLVASGTCLLIYVAKAAKFYIPKEICLTSTIASNQKV